MNAELSCQQCRDALVELTAGTLATADRLAVERHLVSCADCQRERDAWRALGSAIRERGQHLQAGGEAAAGLVRLRAALMLHNDDFDNPLREDSSMERDRWSADDRLTPAPPRDTDHPPTASATTHRRPYPALATTVAIVLLSALIFGVLATRLRPGSSLGATGTATATATLTPTPMPFGQATPEPLPGLQAIASVVSISMVSASDGWAVAITPHNDALLLRYANGRWTPSGDTFAGVSLTNIAMDAHDDGWAVGARSDKVTGVVMHYTGGHWTQVPTPNIQFFGVRVWAFSPTRVMVLASLPKSSSQNLADPITQAGPSARDEGLYTPATRQSGGLGSALLRYDNGAWTEVTSPCGISGMALLSAADFWATCFDSHVLHYQAGHWTTYTISGQASGQDGQPLSIGMTSDSDGWVAGFTNAMPQGMFLARFDGHAWTRVQGPAVSGPTDINSIAMVSPSEGWAGGQMDSFATGLETVLLHYVNGQWEATSPSYSGSIGAIVMVSATEGWAAVGGGGAAGFLHYQNGRWAPYNPGK